MNANEWYLALCAGKLRPVSELSDADLLHERSIAKWWSFPIVYGRNFGAAGTRPDGEQDAVVERFKALDGERQRRKPPLSAFEAAIEAAKLSPYTPKDARLTTTMFKIFQPPERGECRYVEGDGTFCGKPVAVGTGKPFCLHHTPIA